MIVYLANKAKFRDAILTNWGRSSSIIRQLWRIILNYYLISSHKTTHEDYGTIQR
jgi:hypothetical protein